MCVYFFIKQSHILHWKKNICQQLKLDSVKVNKKRFERRKKDVARHFFVSNICPSFLKIHICLSICWCFIVFILSAVNGLHFIKWIMVMYDVTSIYFLTHFFKLCVFFSSFSFHLHFTFMLFIKLSAQIWLLLWLEILHLGSFVWVKRTKKNAVLFMILKPVFHPYGDTDLLTSIVWNFFFGRHQHVRCQSFSVTNDSNRKSRRLKYLGNLEHHLCKCMPVFFVYVFVFFSFVSRYYYRCCRCHCWRRRWWRWDGENENSVQCNGYDIFKLKQTAYTFRYSVGISLKWNIFVVEML